MRAARRGVRTGTGAGVPTAGAGVRTAGAAARHGAGVGARAAGAVVLAAVVVIAGLLCGGCSPPRRGRTVPLSGPGSASAQPPGTYVAVGADETLGEGTQNQDREAFPQVLFRTALPPSVAFVNLGISDATVARALGAEVPRAERLHPTLVSVWLNINDLFDGVSASEYETELGALVHRLSATGATVLVANTPPLDRLPAYLACLDPAHPGPCVSSTPQTVPRPAGLDAAVDAYNAATARVVRTEGVVLVDLHAAWLAARAAGREAGLIDPDGFHPNAAGAQLVAATFAAALPTALTGGGAPPTSTTSAGGAAGGKPTH